MSGPRGTCNHTYLTSPRRWPSAVGAAACRVRQTRRVDTAELRRRAAEMGVSVSYWDWYGNEQQLPDETLAEIVGVLEDSPPPAGLPGDVDRDAVAPVPERRSWGFTVQLYALRSRDSWGHGDLRDLADFATWSARDHGADFVLLNPLHAAEPLPPISASPYLPMSRRWRSPLYLRIADIPEFHHLNSAERSEVAALAAPLRAASLTSELIDRDAVWTAKRTALEIIARVPLSAARQASLDAFRVRQGRALTDWATWCAIAEIHGPDYRTWPRWLRHPGSAEVSALRDELAGRVAFHVWTQWLAAAQVVAAQDAARAAGMAIGIVHDLAVGAHPGGADAWADQDAYAPGFSVGAPPDEFNQRGQDWTMPPWHPRRLAAQAYRPLSDLVRSLVHAGGGLRMDHVMGLSRLWWVPASQDASQGAYVYYDIDATLSVLTSLAARAGAVVIGEDLGTVEPWLRERLAGRGVLGTSMLWFERAGDGTPLPPHAWRRGCLATVSTHDMPPAAAFLTGAQVTERARLGLLTRPVDEERADAERSVTDWLGALASEGLIAPGERPDPGEFTAALYGYVAKSPALLIGVSLAEAAGECRSQNMPGTTTEYPNWRLPLCGPGGAPVLLEDLPASPTIRAVVRAVTGLLHVQGSVHASTGNRQEGGALCRRLRCGTARRGKRWNAITPKFQGATSGNCSPKTLGAANGWRRRRPVSTWTTRRTGSPTRPCGCLWS
jgi:4-alpha-glucanotransferase